MFETLTSFFDPLLTLIYPQECRVCGNAVERSFEGNACSDCWSRVRILGQGEDACDKCGHLTEAKAIKCEQCRDHFYDKAAAAGIYEHALAAAVVAMKSEPIIPPRCRRLLLNAFDRLGSDTSTVIVPIPLSERRHFERGFNQAEILGRFVSRQFNIPLKTDILIRTKHTKKHRAGMDDKARQMTVEKAFALTDEADISDTHIVLIDDVMTSGATASACAKILKKAGATRVDVLTLARAALKYRS